MRIFNPKKSLRIIISVVSNNLLKKHVFRMTVYKFISSRKYIYKQINTKYYENESQKHTQKNET